MKYYVCETRTKSGIGRYAEDFHRCVLAPAGYSLVAPSDLSRQLTGLRKGTRFHIELGAGGYEEKNFLVDLANRGFHNISVTLHDPPFVTFPFFNFKAASLNRMSRGIDWYLNSLGFTSRLLEKCNAVYVLSERGRELTLKRHKGINVKVIPHIVPRAKIIEDPLAGGKKDILFFGFIGEGKGLDYALSLHRAIGNLIPGVKFHVIGEPAGARGVAYLERLKNTFVHDVVFHGYVSEEQLDKLFQDVGHVFLPFKDYRYICPVSGSAINALRRGKVLWTNPVNALPEMIRDRFNGIFFRSSIEANVNLFKELAEHPDLVRNITANAVATLNRCMSETALIGFQ